MALLYHIVKGKGAPLLLLPGIGADHLTFSFVDKFLSPHFTLILPDLRGSGRSFIPERPYTLEEMAEDLIPLLDHLKIERCHLLGHSMGSVLAQILAAKKGERFEKLILANTLSRPEPVAVWAFRAVGHLLERGGAEEIAGEMLLPWLFSPSFLREKKRCEEMIALWTKNPHKQSAKAFFGQYDALIQVETTQLLHQIHLPSLIIAGEEDLLTPLRDAELVASKIPHANLHLLGGVGHVPHIESPEKFAEAALAFLL